MVNLYCAKCRPRIFREAFYLVNMESVQMDTPVVFTRTVSIKLQLLFSDLLDALVLPSSMFICYCKGCQATLTGDLNHPGIDSSV